jgi:hypothetical protein
MKQMNSKKSSRRDFMRQILGTGCLPFAGMAFSQSKSRNITTPSGPFGVIAPEDDRLLNDLEQANFQYFW